MIRNRKGFAIVTLVIFTSVVLIITAGAIASLIANTQMTSEFALGEEVYQLSRAGYDNALLQILRNPSYSGESLTLGNGNVTILVTGTNPKTVLSTATKNGIVRKFTGTAQFVNNQLTVTGAGETQ
jgi:hypothetical protein